MLSAVLLCSSISACAEADAAADDEATARTAALCRGLAVPLACTVGLSSATATGSCDVSIVVSEFYSNCDLTFWMTQTNANASVRARFFTHLVKGLAHMMRHGCGYYLANAGVATRTIQMYLGHRSIQSTERYTALAPDAFRNLWK